MFIRPYHKQDRQSLEAMIVNFQDGEGSLEDCFLPGKDMAEDWLDSMLSAGDLMVAEADEKPVGYICYYVDEGENTLGYNFDRQLYVCDLYVSPDARKQGIGRELLRQAERYGQQEGAKRMILNVLSKNKTAIAMYGRCGYRDYETVMTKSL